jgi:predicted AAA+ superfamily ATPase
LRRLTKKPKHHLVDPALAANLAGVDERALLSGSPTRVAPAAGTWLGAPFESLVTQSVRVYAADADASVGHMRSADTSREVDLIVEDRSLATLAIEVKLSQTVSDADVRHLNWLADQPGNRLADKVVITTGPHAYRRPDGVAVVPLALLGP